MLRLVVPGIARRRGWRWLFWLAIVMLPLVGLLLGLVESRGESTIELGFGTAFAVEEQWPYPVALDVDVAAPAAFAHNRWSTT